MSISMDDVAQHAGVSKSTVSLVLNDRPGASPEMRARVLDAARALGYQLPNRPTPPAGLATGARAPVLALVHCVDKTPDVDPGLTHLYLSYRNGIQRFAQGRDISIMLVTSYQEDNQESLGYQLLAAQEGALDGLILMGPGLRRTGQLIQRVLDQHIPTVILGRSWPDLPISSVSQDHQEQARLVLDHLLALGHSRIGFVARTADNAYDWHAWRLKVYRETMQRQKDGAAAYVAIAETVSEAVRELLAKHPDVTALFCLNDHIAYQAMAAAMEMGRNVPDSLSVVGIDGTIRAQEGLPTLTTVAFPHEEVGYLAAELLLKQIHNQHLRNASMVVRSHLIAGGSSTSPQTRAG